MIGLTLGKKFPKMVCMRMKTNTPKEEGPT
jgi:hypothetical protein